MRTTSERIQFASEMLKAYGAYFETPLEPLVYVSKVVRLEITRGRIKKLAEKRDKLKHDINVTNHTLFARYEMEDL